MGYKTHCAKAKSLNKLIDAAQARRAEVARTRAPFGRTWLILASLRWKAPFGKSAAAPNAAASTNWLPVGCGSGQLARIDPDQILGRAVDREAELAVRGG